MFASRYSFVNPFSVLITGRGERRFVDHYFRPRFFPFFFFCEILKRKKRETLLFLVGNDKNRPRIPVENNKAFCHRKIAIASLIINRIIITVRAHPSNSFDIFALKDKNFRFFEINITHYIHIIFYRETIFRLKI